MIDSCAFEAKPLLTVQEAVALIVAHVDPVQETESIPLGQALGRVLAATVSSPINLPGQNNAAMDGYAFASADLKKADGLVLQCVGVSWAGKPFQGSLHAGQCIRIFTGAVVPAQADSVIMQEQVRVQGDAVHFPVGVKPCQNVRLAGEDVRQGGPICHAGKQLTAMDLALLAAAGIVEVQVLRKLRITIFSTGDELVPLGRDLAVGQIYDSNRYLLKGLLESPAYAVTDGGIVADDRALLETALQDAALCSDLVMTTGGASVGDADYISEVLQRCGQVAFWKIAMKPGKPLAFGKLAGSCFLGLPGNPLAVMAVFQQFVTPALRRLSGLPIGPRLKLQATCTNRLKKAPGRQEYQCGILSQDGLGGFQVASAGQQGSHLLGTLQKANCYIVLPSGCQGVNEGEQVTVEPFGVHI